MEVEYQFTAPELQRLAMYRAAVRAGFYTDRIDRPEPMTSTFTKAEQVRLGTLKLAISRGQYSEGT